MNPPNRDLLTLRSQKPAATHFPLVNELSRGDRQFFPSLYIGSAIPFESEWVQVPFKVKWKLTLFIHSSRTDLFYFHFLRERALPWVRVAEFALSLGEVFFLNFPVLERIFRFSWLCCDFEEIPFFLKKAIVIFVM